MLQDLSKICTSPIIFGVEVPAQYGERVHVEVQQNSWVVIETEVAKGDQEEDEEEPPKSDDVLRSRQSNKWGTVEPGLGKQKDLAIIESIP